jgi:hypothetical protein
MFPKLGSANSNYGWAILHDIFPLLDSKYPFPKRLLSVCQIHALLLVIAFGGEVIAELNESRGSQL